MVSPNNGAVAAMAAMAAASATVVTGAATSSSGARMGQQAAVATAATAAAAIVGRPTTTTTTTTTNTKATRSQLLRAAGSKSLDQLMAAISTGWTREEIDAMATPPLLPLSLSSFNNGGTTTGTTCTTQPPQQQQPQQQPQQQQQQQQQHCGKTALHMAAWCGGLDNLKYLVDELGCNVNVIATGPHSYGKTPIIFACTRSRIEHVEFLLQRGAHVKIVNNKGQTLRSLAYSHFPTATTTTSTTATTTTATTESFATSRNLLETIRQMEQDEQAHLPWTNYRHSHSDGFEYGDLDPRFLDRHLRSTDLIVPPWSVNPTTQQSRRGNFRRNNPQAVVVAMTEKDKNNNNNSATTWPPSNTTRNKKKSHKSLRILSMEEQEELHGLWQSLSDTLQSSVPPTLTGTTAMELLLQILSLCDKQQKSWLNETATQLFDVWNNRNKKIFFATPNDDNHEKNQDDIARRGLDESKTDGRVVEGHGDDHDVDDDDAPNEKQLLVAWIKTILPMTPRQREILQKLALCLVDDDDSTTLDKDSFPQPLLSSLSTTERRRIKSSSSSSSSSMARQSLNSGLWPQACRAVAGLSFAQSLTVVQKSKKEEKNRLHKSTTLTRRKENDDNNNDDDDETTIIGLKEPPIWIDTVDGLKELRQLLLSQPPHHHEDDGDSHSCSSSSFCGDHFEVVGDVVGIDTEWINDVQRPGKADVSTLQLAILLQPRRRSALPTSNDQSPPPRVDTDHKPSSSSSPPPQLQSYVIDVLMADQQPQYRKVFRDFLIQLLQTKIVLGFAVGNDIPKLEYKINKYSNAENNEPVVCLDRGNVLDLQRLWGKKQQPGLATCAGYYCRYTTTDTTTTATHDDHENNNNNNTQPNNRDSDNQFGEENYQNSGDYEDDNKNKNTTNNTPCGFRNRNEDPYRVRLSKAEQCSNWKQRPLRNEQLEYGALDAAVLLVILAEKARADE